MREARKVRTDLKQELLSSSPDWDKIDRLLVKEQQTDRELKNALSVSFRKLLKRLPPADRLIYARDLYQETPPPMSPPLSDKQGN